MKPVKTPETNFTFKLEGGTDENDLPVFALEDLDGQMMSISTWELEKEEQDLVAEGGRIQLVIWGSGHPPVALRVEYSEKEHA